MKLEIPPADRARWLARAYAVMHEKTPAAPATVALGLYAVEHRRDVRLDDLADHLGVHRTTLRKWCDAAGLRSRRTFDPARVVEMVAAYNRHGSLDAAAAEVGVSRKAVRRHVVAAGGEIRPRVEVVNDRIRELNPPPPGWVTTVEAARMLGVSRKGLQDRARRGTIPGLRKERRPGDDPARARMRYLIPVAWVRLQVGAHDANPAELARDLRDAA